MSCVGFTGLSSVPNPYVLFEDIGDFRLNIAIVDLSNPEFVRTLDVDSAPRSVSKADQKI